MANTQLEKYRRVAKTLKNPTPVELPSGKFRCQVTVDGVRESVVHEDPRVAHAQALAIKENLLEAKKKPKSMTLESAIEAYIAMNEGELSPATIRGYENVKKHRFKGLMHTNIYDISKKDLQQAISKESEKVSAKTVYNAYGVVRPVLKEFGIQFWGIKLPQQIKPIKKYIQSSEIGKLIEAIKGDSCEIPILLAVWLGLRRSEIVGLCWDCIDFEQKVIHIRRAYVPNKHNKWVLKAGAKNEPSQRTVQCPDYILEKIKSIPRTQNEKIFSIHPETIRRHTHAACKRAGITDTSVHDLRHTNAAVMKGLHVDDEHAMGRGGWTNENTYKKIYAYVFDETAETEDNRIDSFFLDKIAHENAHNS
nr:MAG TPA: Integrase [Caudoviricetes sp.]